jgi:hypothetical protein
MDLNGDGDMLDEIPHYIDGATGATVSSGLGTRH